MKTEKLFKRSVNWRAKVSKTSTGKDRKDEERRHALLDIFIEEGSDREEGTAERRRLLLLLAVEKVLLIEVEVKKKISKKEETTHPRSHGTIGVIHRLATVTIPSPPARHPNLKGTHATITKIQGETNCQLNSTFHFHISKKIKNLFIA